MRSVVRIPRGSGADFIHSTHEMSIGRCAARYVPALKSLFDVLKTQETEE